MDKKVLAGIIAVVVIIGAVAVFAMKPFGVAKPTTTNLNQAVNEPVPDQAMSGTMRQLISSGKNVTCTFERSDADGAQRGTIYVAGKKMRGDFTVSLADGSSFTSHMIQDNDWTYTWGGPLGAQQGVKMKIANAASGDATGQQKQNLDFDQAMNFDCRSWDLGDSQFNPPTDVTFTEFTVPVQPTAANANANTNQAGEDQPSGDQVKSVQCGACEQLSAADAQQQCRQALGC